MKLISKIVSYTTTFVSLLLILRVLLMAAGAGVEALFVTWLYGVTDELMIPFHGIFPSPTLGENRVLDVPALFALAIYMGVGYVLAAIIASAGNAIRSYIKSLFVKKPQDKENKPGSGYSGINQPPGFR